MSSFTAIAFNEISDPIKKRAGGGWWATTRCYRAKGEGGGGGGPFSCHRFKPGSQICSLWSILYSPPGLQAEDSGKHNSLLLLEMHETKWVRPLFCWRLACVCVRVYLAGEETGTGAGSPLGRVLVFPLMQTGCDKELVEFNMQFSK